VRPHRLVGPLVAVCLAAACGGGGNEPAHPPRSTSTSTTAQHRLTAVVDPALGHRRIEVVGTPQVGTRLVARISPDLEGRIESWGWHRCIEIPSCLTIKGADDPKYTPTDADAWQLLRIIAVADGRAVGTEIGPVVNPHPKPFRTELTLDPSVNENRLIMVAPGEVRVVADAACPVTVLGGEKSATSRGTTKLQALPSTAPATHVEVTGKGDGGQLLVFVTGTCDRATVVVSGTR
jgi:hypothetical protein